MSWRPAEPDPAGTARASQPYQVLPELTAEEFAALKTDIAARGVLVPVEIDETGAVLDGHHRIRAWHELRSEGLRVPPYPRVVRYLPDEQAKVAHALSLNLARRHLGVSERQAVVQRLRAEGWSLRRIAEALGVVDATVRRDLRGASYDAPGRVVGADGKTYQAARPAPPASIVVATDGQQARAQAALGALGDDAPGRLLVLGRAEEHARRAHLARLGASPAAPAAGSGWDLRCGGFVDALADVEDGSVDAVICDPPYVDEALAVWGQIGAFAARVLRPGRVLACYCGHLRQPEVMAALGEHLSFVWCGATVQRGRSGRFRARRVWVGHRPWLVYSAGVYEPRGWIDDTLASEGRGEKAATDHPWRQALAPFVRLVEMFSLPGELVVDPMVGQGTTGVAALGCGRRFLGCDVDPAAVAMSRARLEELR